MPINYLTCEDPVFSIEWLVKNRRELFRSQMEGVQQECRCKAIWHLKTERCTNTFWMAHILFKQVGVYTENKELES